MTHTRAPWGKYSSQVIESGSTGECYNSMRRDPNGEWYRATDVEPVLEEVERFIQDFINRSHDSERIAQAVDLLTRLRARERTQE